MIFRMWASLANPVQVLPNTPTRRPRQTHSQSRLFVQPLQISTNATVQRTQPAEKPENLNKLRANLYHFPTDQLTG